MFINKNLIGFAGNYKKKLLFVSFLQALQTLTLSAISLLTAFIVKRLIRNFEATVFDDLWSIFVAIFSLVILRFAISKYASVQALKCSVGIKRNLRTRLQKKIFVLGPAYTGKHRTGGIVSTIWSKVEWLNDYYAKYVPSAISAIINTIIIFAILILIDPIVAITCLLFSAAVLVCPIAFYQIMKDKGFKEASASAKYYSDCLDGIQGIVTLKSFNSNDKQREKINNQGEILRKTIMQHLSITFLENLTLEFFARLGAAATVVVGIVRALNGNMEIENLVYILFLSTAWLNPMSAMISAWHKGYRGATGAEKISDMLKQDTSISLFNKFEENIDNLSYLINNDNNRNLDVSFIDVNFFYNKKEKQVLKNISFNIPNGTTLAIVGPSGSGKSTIANLLCGFYRTDTGSIKVGDKILNEENVLSIQNQISAVWQENYLFYGTCYDNILMGNPNATHEEVINATKRANIHNFIMNLENGYDTVVGERGVRLSSGEKQRISIARAFLKDTPLIIFDEATSALDRRNEIAIQNSLNKLIAGKTTLVIAHRLETIKNAEQILVLRDGFIEGTGTHKELLGKSNFYQKLMSIQV
ncbi:MAG: ABC transporter ATP-binding protein/permease [Clostridiales bacterium]|nr:ABC transporter ATP-binding protein/permease [Clostridiales bacterium]